MTPADAGRAVAKVMAIRVRPERVRKSEGPVTNCFLLAGSAQRFPIHATPVCFVQCRTRAFRQSDRETIFTESLPRLGIPTLSAGEVRELFYAGPKRKNLLLDNSRSKRIL